MVGCMAVAADMAMVAVAVIDDEDTPLLLWTGMSTRRGSMVDV